MEQLTPQTQQHYGNSQREDRQDVHKAFRAAEVNFLNVFRRLAAAERILTQPTEVLGASVYLRVLEIRTNPFAVPDPAELGLHVYSLKNLIGTTLVTWPQIFRDMNTGGQQYQPSDGVNTVSSIMVVKEGEELAYPVTLMMKGTPL